MSRINRLSVAGSLLAALFAAQALHAATYYVATQGDDARSCLTAANANTPKRTINNAVPCLQAGDTLLIRGGVYPEALNEYYRRIPSGTSWSSPVTIAGYPGEKAIMRPNGGPNDTDVIRVMGPAGGTHHVIFRNLVLDAINMPQGGPGKNGIKMTNTGSDLANEAHHIRVEGCEIMNAAAQGILGCGKNSEILRNNIHHNGNSKYDHGIYCSSENLLVDGNDVHHNFSYGIHIYKSGGPAGPNIVVRNNRTHDNASAGIIVGGVGTLAYNNISWNNGSGIDVKYSQARDIRVFNNTAYANSRYGIFVYNAPNTQLINNIVFKNGTPITSEGTNPGLLQSNNLTSDPLFFNAAGADFHLRAGSPAINAGVNLYSAGVTKDFAGVVRPQTGPFEIGAYEYGGTPPPSFDFSLSNGGNKTVTQGGSGTNSLTASLVSGTAQAVSFSISGLPSGVTGSFAPASCTPNCSSTLTLSASASAATGNASVTITAAGGGITKTSAFTLTVNATAPPPPPSGGPVGWWKLDENIGLSAADGSGNGNNGTLTNGPVWTAGRMGSGLAFDGTNDSVTIPHSPSLALAGAFSMAAWVNPAISTTSFKSVMVKNYSHFLYASVKGYCGNGAVMAGFVGSGTRTNVCERNPLPVNTWTHLAATTDGSVMRLYRNGVMTSSAVVTGAPIASTGTLQLGASRYGEFFNGKLDEARVYNRALSAAEVLALFNAAPSGVVTDINGDGITNVTDIQIAINQASGAAACTTGDVNKDGMCNVADVQLVVNRSLGL